MALEYWHDTVSPALVAKAMAKLPAPQLKDED